MSSRGMLLAVATVLVVSGPIFASITSLVPLSTVVDESGFGTLHDSLSSPFNGGDFVGTLDSRVYVDTIPATQVTFVFDLQVTLAFSGVWDMTIAATGIQNDLRIGEIIGGTNGYISGTTTNDPDNVDAINNVYPVLDELFYEWLSGNELTTGSRATLYITTTGAVDIGVVSAAIHDGGTASALVLAPVDNPSSPDMNVPEPVSLAILGAGGCLVLLRRRR